MLSNNVALELELPAYHVDTYNMTEMMTYFPIFKYVLNHVPHKSICEVGSNQGITSKVLYDYCRKNGIQLQVVDPKIPEVLKNLEEIRYYEMTSSEYFMGGGKSDVYILDGDHNFSTVTEELNAVLSCCGKKNVLCFLHDVSWPWARRDLFYSPDVFHDKDYEFDQSLHLESEEFTYRGFPSGTTYAMAKEYGGKHSGVQTAVDDFLQEHGEYLEYVRIPTLYGLGILISKNLISEPLRNYFDILLGLKPMLSMLEANRLRLIQGLDEHRYDLNRKNSECSEITIQVQNSIAENAKLKSSLSELEAKLEASTVETMEVSNRLNRQQEEYHSLRRRLQSSRVFKLINYFAKYV